MTWRELRRALAGLALGFVTFGCRGRAAEGSCFRDRDSVCTEFAGDRAAAGKRMCAGFTWREGASSCPAENRLGTCQNPSGGVIEIFYSGPPNHYTPEAARSECASSRGQWTAGSNR